MLPDLNVSPTVARFYTRSAVPRFASGGAVLIGVIALVGWILDLPGLRSIIPGAVEMKANTALGLVTAGFALFVLADATSRIPGRRRILQSVASVRLVTLDSR
jgi:ascorbate-specific PTS system EIIC-type component UlaA